MSQGILDRVEYIHTLLDEVETGPHLRLMSPVEGETLDALNRLDEAQLAFRTIRLPRSRLELHQKAHELLEVATRHHLLKDSALLAHPFLLLALLQLLYALAAVVDLLDYGNRRQC